MSKTRKIVLGGLVLTAVVIGVTALLPTEAEARPIGGPLCGPTYQWSCSGPGGPDILFVGTVCDKIKFERKTGLTCTPI